MHKGVKGKKEEAQTYLTVDDCQICKTFELLFPNQITQMLQ
jgi:hypothetical protein